ncbi:MAG: endolytic transglycosylase MltG [Phocaeicola plebeius]|nr:endolytic transglycosylase MltG [Phocaeicola plebeius]
MTRKKKLFLISALTAAVLAVATLAGGYCLLTHRPFHTARPVVLYIDADDTADSVYAKLRRDLNATSLTGFRLLSALYHYPEQVHCGAYRMDAATSALDAFRQLRYGHQTPVRLVVPSVRTLDRLAGFMGRKLMADSAAFARVIADSVFTDSLGFDRYTLPALFLPDTYEVYWTTSPHDLLLRMKREYNRYWNETRRAQAAAIGLTPVEVATLASIVEEETAQKAEKPLVAGLYINRLHRGMPLQADPTVKFALQDFGLRRILYAHLETDSPYNTYRQAGLPPGPIRIATPNGLESVLGYTRHTYLYMCAKEDFSGFHNFATTLTEHQRNARRYQQELNRRKIKP